MASFVHGVHPPLSEGVGDGRFRLLGEQFQADGGLGVEDIALKDGQGQLHDDVLEGQPVLEILVVTDAVQRRYHVGDDGAVEDDGLDVFGNLVGGELVDEVMAVFRTPQQLGVGGVGHTGDIGQHGHNIITRRMHAGSPQQTSSLAIRAACRRAAQ